MKGLGENFLESLSIGRDWTLFLDRDGVINRKIDGDYVRCWEQFEFLPGVIEALCILKNVFGRIVVVTNQRGVGRGIMTEETLRDIHNKMLKIIRREGGKIDAIYYCPHDYEKEECNCRKPKIGMALQAKEDFPDIIFSKSIMVGDSLSDIEFAKRAGMVGVLVGKDYVDYVNLENVLVFRDLYQFASFLTKG